MGIYLCDDKQIWDKFVDESPLGLIFHKWEFLTIIKKYTKLKLHRLGIYRGENLIGIFPIFIQNNYFTKFIFSPPPRTAVPYLGFLMNSEYDTLKQNKKESFLKTVVTDINGYLNNLGSNYTSLSTVPGFLDVRQFKWLNYSVDPSYTYFINLNKNLEEIYNGFRRDVRQEIRKAESNGLRVEFNHNISSIYNFQEKRYSEQGLNLPLLNEFYLRDLVNAFPDELMVFHMFDGRDNLLSSVITSQFKRFLVWFGHTKPHGTSNDLFMWRLLEYAKNNNFDIFELVGANTNNLCAFKSKFNPYLEITFNITKKDLVGSAAEWFYLNIIKRK